MTPPAAMGRIEALLAARIGLDTATVGANLVSRAVRQRMAERGVADADRYVELLERSEEEAQALVEVVVIPESWFFRDDAPFRLFREHARAGWVAQPGRAPLRAMSIPCAGGEEPYSLAIAMAEVGLPPERHRLDAVDVSLRRLDAAREGVYSANAFRGGDLAYRDRYFRRHPRGFEIDPALRGRVRFLGGSILDPALLKHEPPYDVIFCRNLLIYLGDAARAAAMATLDRLLAADGLLVIGHADRLGLAGRGPLFAPVGEPRAFAYRRALSLPAPSRAMPRLPSPPPTSRRPPPKASPHPTVVGGESRNPDLPLTKVELDGVPRPDTRARWIGPSSPPGPPTAPPAPPSPPAAEEVDSLLARATELANANRADEAIAACNEYLKGPRRSAAVYAMLGVLYQSIGNRRGAEDSFKKAAYLDPDHDEAHLALALIAERRGEKAEAAAHRRRAERARLKKGGA
ncbi:putative biofilm formation methyltransferase WspC [Aquisphaera giovannonii]|uniref:Putative biofilm formation methyltransferase WspC n=1 Tax=Aquisphaera giovannonii TaxID=406548 RepID=A0A5B9VVS8_9BACT|nr:protein-glutamate O-methyltransferase CheR [Aquisphaera giovannonii]QEH31895.1 putative biofilm formation methyltransferase WspC [Aquisphaera giovannonii]